MSGAGECGGTGDPGGPLRWRVGTADGLLAVGFEIVHAALSPTAIAKVTLPAEAVWAGSQGGGLVLSGRGPQWLYGRLVGLAQGFDWVAVHEPRLADNEGSAAVVVRSDGGRRTIGTRVRFPHGLIGADRVGQVVAVLGPPHSGKTQLLGGFTDALRARAGLRLVCP